MPPSLQGVERGAYLLVGRALPVILLDLGPRDAARFVEHVNGWSRDAVEFLPHVCRVAQAVSVDHPVIRVGEQVEGDRARAIGRDLFGEVPALFGLVRADDVQPNRLARLK